MSAQECCMRNVSYFNTKKLLTIRFQIFGHFSNSECPSVKKKKSVKQIGWFYLETELMST